MAGPERFDALRFMGAFRADEQRLGDALALFVEREDYGFVWLAYREDSLVGCASVGYTIVTSAGGIVATVRDLYVAPTARRTGVASALLAQLRARLDAAGVVAIDIDACGDPAVATFLIARGFRPTAGSVFRAGR